MNARVKVFTKDYDKIKKVTTASASSINKNSPKGASARRRNLKSNYASSVDLRVDDADTNQSYALDFLNKKVSLINPPFLFMIVLFLPNLSLEPKDPT